MKTGTPVAHAVNQSHSSILTLPNVAAPGMRVGVHHGAQGIEQGVLLDEAGDLILFERGPNFVRNVGEDEFHPGFAEGVVDRTQGRGTGEIDVVDGTGVDAEPLQARRGR